MHRQSALPYVWMLCGSLSFAVMGTLAHELHGVCRWPVLALARAGFPLVLTLALAGAGRVRLVLWRPATLWLRSLAGSLAILCTFYSLTRLPTEDVFALSNMFPIWVAVLSWPMLGEFPSGGVWLAVASGVAGVVCIQQPHLAGGDFTALIALASSLFSAVAMLGLHRLRHLDARAIVVHFSAVALVFAIACQAAFGTLDDLAAGVQGWPLLGLTAVGVMATAGQLFLTRAYATGDPAKVSVVGLTQIVFAMVIGQAVLGHELHPMTLLGIGLVIAPTAWVMLRRDPVKPSASSADSPR